MLDFATALDLMKKYGYSSTSTHPYIYQNGDSIGICYLYYDEEFGSLERIKIFDNAEKFENFLKELEWVGTNGKNYHVRMILDNYEGINPKVMFLRNEKLMVEGEMFDIANFDLRESQRQQMDDVSKLIYEAGDLLLVYDEIKNRQLQYLMNLIKLKNSLREKYFELQKEVDIYNKYKVEREITLLPEITDSGINETIEIAIKDRYNMYVAQRPTYEEASQFLKEVWDLNKALELNSKYYDAQKEETDIRNEFKVVNKKLDLMHKLNENLRPLFGIDLVSHFRKINKVCMKESNSISQEWIQDQLATIERKYSVYDNLNLLYTSDYLREAIQNSNYADLAIKYSKNSQEEGIHRARRPLNEVAASLSIQYQDKLDADEQAILVLYNNHKYRILCDGILKIENFESVPLKKLVGIISRIKGFSKVKSICYDAVKKRLEDPINDSIKNSLFSHYDFTTFETFVASLVKELVKLRNVNNKMVLNGDINMYLVVDKVEDINNMQYISVTNALNDLLGETKGTKSMIGITLLKEYTPVLYSPYYLDIGDVYSKDASLQMAIKEMIDFELLVETSDIVINIDPKKTNVVRYYSQPHLEDNISVVDDIKMSYKTVFCKYAFTSNLGGNVELVEAPVVSATNEQQPVAEQSTISVVSTASEKTNNVDSGLNIENVIPIAKENEVKTVLNSEMNKANSSELNTPSVKEIEKSVDNSTKSEQKADINAVNSTAKDVSDLNKSVKNEVVVPNKTATMNTTKVVNKPLVSGSSMNTDKKVATISGKPTGGSAMVKPVQNKTVQSVNHVSTKPLVVNNNGNINNVKKDVVVQENGKVSPVVQSGSAASTAGVNKSVMTAKAGNNAQSVSKPVMNQGSNSVVKPAPVNKVSVNGKPVSNLVRPESPLKPATTGGVKSVNQVVKQVVNPSVSSSSPVQKTVNVVKPSGSNMKPISQAKPLQRPIVTNSSASSSKPPVSIAKPTTALNGQARVAISKPVVTQNKVSNSSIQNDNK